MQITHEQVEPLWTTLQVDSFHPPREAVAALFALASPTDREHVHVGATWEKPGCTGAVTWTLLALTHDGLVVVTASAADQWDWRRESHKYPEGKAVDARWVPFSQVQGLTVHVTWVASNEPTHDSSHYGLQFSDSWTLLLIDTAPVQLTVDQSEGARDRLQKFLGRLRSALCPLPPSRH